MRLGLVCRFWKAIVDRTPSFWGHIKADDGLQHARNALTKTGESPIDLFLGFFDVVTVDEFLEVVNRKVSCWRSVELEFDALPTSFGGLHTSACHSLEELSLTWDFGNSYPPTSPLTLFDGAPAPTTLKNLTLYGVPVGLAPMRLSKLLSLELTEVPSIMMDDILLVLRNSPMLLILSLEELGSLHVPARSVGLPILLEALARCTLHLSIPLIRFLLSALKTPSLHHLELACELGGSIPTSHLFASPLSSFTPTLRTLLSHATHIKIILELSNSASITFGGLVLILDSPGPGRFRFQRFREVLDSLMRHIGDRGKDLKVHLDLVGVDPTTEELQIFNRSPMVEQLLVHATFWGAHIPNVITALGTPITAPHAWLFPDLEVIHWNANLAQVGDLERALGVRYFQTEPTLQTCANERQHPRLLKEIRFLSKDSHITEPTDWKEILRRVHSLSRGARVFFRDSLLNFDTIMP
ncbi:hypothetical protein FRC01_001100 [Tulasnella sp. 417]|nr:hypothetical protein FRC01_001100 [Tulasnella sp. 417]